MDGDITAQQVVMAQHDLVVDEVADRAAPHLSDHLDRTERTDDSGQRSALDRWISDHPSIDDPKVRTVTNVVITEDHRPVLDQRW
jgi:hypothetical protein